WYSSRRGAGTSITSPCGELYTFALKPMLSSSTRVSKRLIAHWLISVSQRELHRRYLVAFPPWRRPPLPQRSPSSRNSLKTRSFSATPETFQRLVLIAASSPPVIVRCFT